MRYKNLELPFDFRSLEIFLAVCESGGMAGAATKLGLTQPAVSKAISDLEKKAGVTLFDRTCRPLALTAGGTLMRQQAAVLIADARNIPLLLREAKQGRHASIRVGLVDSLSRALTLLLSAYLKPHAHEISIRSGLTAMHAGELLTRKLDLFLGVDDLEETSGLERWEICREPYVLLLSPGSRPITTVENFKRFAEVNPFIRFSARSQTGADVERHLRLLGVNPTRSFEYDSPSAVAAMVSAGQGFAISTPLCLSESQYFEQVTTCPLPGPIFLRKLSVVARMGELGGIPREVADVARNALGKMVGAFNG